MTDKPISERRLKKGKRQFSGRQKRKHENAPYSMGIIRRYNEYQAKKAKRERERKELRETFEKARDAETANRILTSSEEKE